ncbi:MAG TPA: AsmA-like C-terminal region-containing protein [Acidisphaera sp.]|nr:AsmA-like C-terminal region-containing protein [Acidisphaera sp.]
MAEFNAKPVRRRRVKVWSIAAGLVLLAIVLVVARANASAHLLPDTPIDIPKFEMADVSLHYRAASIEGGRRQPLSNLDVALDLNNGVLRLHPISFGIGTGTIAGNVALTPVADNETRLAADIDFRRVSIAQLMKVTPGFTGAGTIGGRAEINSQGRSLAQFLGYGSGDLKLFTEGGDLSSLLVALSGLQFGNALLAALQVPSHTELRCMVVDMPLQHGVLTTRTFLIDTRASNIDVKGSIDLRDERLDLTVDTMATHVSIGSLPTPVDIGGTFRDPSIMPKPGPLIARAGAAVLGTPLTPLGALIPTIQLGLGKDTDCGRVVSYEAATGPARVSPAERHRRLGH